MILFLLTGFALYEYEASNAWWLAFWLIAFREGVKCIDFKQLIVKRQK